MKISFLAPIIADKINKVKKYLHRRKFNPNKVDSIIASNVAITGDLEYNGQVLFNGTIKGFLVGSAKIGEQIQAVTISSSGSVIGDITGDYVIISGKVQGNITAYENVLIKSGGVVEGSISYGTIKIEENAIIIGQLKKI
jgi:cytoskeletal protein CcmA (bactofilin family)